MARACAAVQGDGRTRRVPRSGALMWRKLIIEVRTDLTPQELMSEIVSHLDSLKESHTLVRSVIVYVDGKPVADYEP